MAIDFVYVIMAFVYLLLIMAFIIKDETMALISGIGILIVGIYLAIYGAGDLRNFLTEGFAIINIGLGAYVFIRTSLDKIQELF